MKNILIIFLLLTALPDLSAQCSNSWLVNSNTNNGNTVLFPVPSDMVNDSQDNLIMTGDFETSFIYQNISYSCQMLTDIYVLKTTSNNNVLWGKHFYSTVNPIGSEIHASSLVQGNASSVYIAGYFKGTVTFDSFTLTEGGGGWNAFVIKLNCVNGNVVWAKSFGINSGIEQFYSIDINNNLLYLSGKASASLTINSFTVNASGNTPTMLAVLDTSGTVVNAASYGANGLNKIKVMPGGDLLLTCSYNNNFSMGNTAVTNNGYNDILISRINRITLSPKWTMFSGSSGGDSPKSITVDQSANAYLLFEFSQTMNWGTQTLTSRGMADIGVSKIDSTGAIAWVKSFGGPMTEYGGKIKMLVDSLVVTATCGDSVKFSGGINLNNQNKGLLNPLLVKFDNSGNRLGHILGNDTTSSPPQFLFNIPGPLSIDNTNGIYWAGEFLNHLTIADLHTNLSSNNNTTANSFLVKICDLNVSIRKNATDQFSVNMFPNPSQGLFYVSGMNANAEIEIYNSVGDLIYKTKTASNETQIDLREINAGIYVLRYRNALYTYTGKLVKE